MPNPARKHWFLAVAALIGVVAISFAAFHVATPASAATITVNTSADVEPPADDSDCSLREAISNANVDGQTYDDCDPADGDDLIVFDPAVTMITLDYFLPEIQDADGLTIDGDETVTISGDNNYRPFFIIPDADLTLQNITLTMGNQGTGSGGAILNQGTLVLDTVQITNSNANLGGGGIANFGTGTATMTDSSISGTSSIAGDGGGISNAGMFTINNSDISGSAFGNGGGVSNEGTLIIEAGSSISGQGVNGGGIYNQTSATLTDSTVTNSNATLGGGIYNIGVFTLDNSDVIENIAANNAGVHNGVDSVLHVLSGSRINGNTSTTSGGGLGNEGTADVTDSNIDGNTAANFGGGILTAQESQLTITDSTVSNNTATAGSGGGIEMSRGTLTVLNSEINGNDAGDDGGAINSFDGIFTTTLTNVTMSGNTAVNQGGAIYAGVTSSTLAIHRSTLSGNTAGFGGALYVRISSATIANSTISTNTAQYGGGIYSGENGTTTLINSTVANNTATTLGAGIYNPDDVAGTTNLTNTIVAEQQAGADCAGLGIVSHGHNLDSLNTCNLNATGDIHDGFASLGALADNGGPTFTHALIPFSDAIDAGDDAVCAADPINNDDQRNTSRPKGAHCDIGSYEAAVTTPTPTESPTPSPSPVGTPTPTPTNAPGTDTELWGDNDCSGVITIVDAIRDFLAILFPEDVEPIAGCPEMGSTIQAEEPADEQALPQGGGPLIWGDVHCTESIEETDALAVLYYIVGLPDLGHSGFCPEVGQAITFTQ
jgi:CSLREA domain-containing protein